MSPQELEEATKNLREGLMGCEKGGSGESSDEGNSLASNHEMSRSEALAALVQSKGKTPIEGKKPADATTHKSKRPRLTRCGSFFDSDSDSDVAVETRDDTSLGSPDQAKSDAGSSENRLSDTLRKKRVRQFDDSSESESESQPNGFPSQRESLEKNNVNSISNKPLKKSRKLMLESDSESESDDDCLVMDLVEERVDEGSIRSPPVSTLDDGVHDEVWFGNDQEDAATGSMGALVVSQTLVN